MNERINELVEIAEQHAYSDGVGQQCRKWHDKFNEKFAELIVKECLNIVGHYADVDEGISVAKLHFGVE